MSWRPLSLKSCPQGEFLTHLALVPGLLGSYAHKILGKEPAILEGI